MKNNFVTLSPGKTNCYLIKAKKGYLLIDTGYEKDYGSFLKALDKKSIEVSEINYLLLTHHHDDHSGFTNNLLEDTDLKIITHEKSKALLKTGKNDKTRGGGYINKRVYYLSKIYKLLNPDWDLTFPPVKLRDDDLLINDDNKELLRTIGINATILFTPGHTIDSISVVLDSGEVFCGDAAMSWPLWAGIKYCTIFITDIEAFYNSWKKIIESDAKIVYPSHGKSFKIEKLRKNMSVYTQESLVKFF